METAVLPHGGEGCFEMDVLVRAVNNKVVKISANDRFCCLRAMTDLDVDALRQFEVALVTRESEDVEPGSSPLGESLVSNRLIAPLRASGSFSSGRVSRPTDLEARPFRSDKVLVRLRAPFRREEYLARLKASATLSSLDRMEFLVRLLVPLVISWRPGPTNRPGCSLISSSRLRSDENDRRLP